jgi:hypothetical protein
MTLDQIVRSAGRWRVQKIADEVLETRIELRVEPRKIDQIGGGHDGRKLPAQGQRAASIRTRPHQCCQRRKHLIAIAIVSGAERHERFAQEAHVTLIFLIAQARRSALLLRFVEDIRPAGT